jgi:hypothetical protein
VGTSIGSLVLIVALLAAGYMVWPDALSLETTLDHHAACMTMTLIIAAVPMAALVGSRRGCDPVHPACTAMSLAAAVGLWASLSTVLVCPMAGPVHMLFGHILPMALLLAFGAFVLQKVIALK